MSCQVYRRFSAPRAVIIHSGNLLTWYICKIDEVFRRHDVQESLQDFSRVQLIQACKIESWPQHMCQVDVIVNIAHHRGAVAGESGELLDKDRFDAKEFDYHGKFEVGGNLTAGRKRVSSTPDLTREFLRGLKLFSDWVCELTGLFISNLRKALLIFQFFQPSQIMIQLIRGQGLVCHNQLIKVIFSLFCELSILLFQFLCSLFLVSRNLLYSIRTLANSLINLFLGARWNSNFIDSSDRRRNLFVYSVYAFYFQHESACR